MLRELSGNDVGNVLMAALSCVVAVGSLVVLSSGGPLFRWTGVDVHFLAPWITASAVVFLFGRIIATALNVQERRSPEKPDYAPSTADDGTGDAAVAQDFRTRLLMYACSAYLRGLAAVLLIAGAVSAIPDIPFSVAHHVPFPNLISVAAYLQVFNSLAVLVLLVGMLFTGVRAAKGIWPEASAAVAFPVAFPWMRLAALAAAYVLLSGGGVLAVAFGFSGGRILLLLALILILPYLASVLRRIASLSSSRGARAPVRLALLLAECGWIVLMLGMMVSLPGIANGYLDGRPQEVQDFGRPFLGVLDTLSFWSIVLLGPFILIRAVAAFRPTLGEVLGFPLGRIVLFGLALVAFSDSGLAATASEFPTPRLMPVLSAALAISYLAQVLHRIGSMGLVPRFSSLLANVPPLVATLVHASAWSLVVWTVLDSVPLVSGPLLDSRLTVELGEVTLPYFGGLFDVRNHLAALTFVTVLALDLPEPLWATARWKIRPLLAGVGFMASGCLLWVAGAQLSGVGHVFAMAGAVGGTGMLALGAAQLAAYWSDSDDPLVSGAARWLTSSRLRAVLIGASLAFYGMLLRPLLFDTLWFAPLYEWLVVLVVSIWAIVRIRGTVKNVALEADAGSPALGAWNRHEQVLEDRPDPRWELVEGWRRRFIESGEWSGLWSYLMGLLCRNNARPESARDVFRPLRHSSNSPPRIPFIRRRRLREQELRGAALEQSLRCAAQALEGTSASAAAANPTDIQEAAGQFIADGGEPETMAAMVVEAYSRRGADLGVAVNLWFPMVHVDGRPPRWFEPPWVRRRNRARAQARRRRLAEGALAHLSGQGDLSLLPVAIASRPTPLFLTAFRTRPYRPASREGSGPQGTRGGAAAFDPAGGPEMSRFTQHQLRAADNRGANRGVSGPLPIATIPAGQGIEVLDESEDTYYVRTAQNLLGYVHKSDLSRRPILPGDEVGGTR